MAAVALISIIAFVFGFVGSMPLAGPIAVLMVSSAFQGRYGAALRLGLGAAAAEAIYAFIAFFGFTTLLARYPIVVPISHGVTAVVLLAVGGYFVTWKEKAPDAADRAKAAKSRESKGTPFVVGFTICALNPTLLVTWSAATATLYSKGVAHMTNTMAIAFGLAAGLGVATWDVVLVLLARRYKDRFPRMVLTWIIRGMGILLVAIAIWSAVDLVRYVSGRPT